MKKKNILLGTIKIAVFIIITLIIMNLMKKDLWDINADKLKKSFQPISGDAVIDDLSQWTPFEWDVLYSFAPYTPKEDIYRTIGYKWDNISETVSEGMNQIVFVKDGKVVCYLYGYPENVKLGFDMGEYRGSYYIELKSEQKLSFTTTISEKGVRSLIYNK